jgi:hypothetical protein
MTRNEATAIAEELIIENAAEDIIGTFFDELDAEFMGGKLNRADWLLIQDVCHSLYMSK